MDPFKSSDFAIFQPRSFVEALVWASQLENYSLRDAFNRRSLKIPTQQVSKCGQRRLNKRTLHYVQYQLNYENTLVTATAPQESVLSFPEDTEGGAAGFLFRLHGGKQYFKKFYFHSVGLTFLLVLLASAFFFVYLKNWMLGHVLQDHWIIVGRCDLACAKKAVQIHVSLWFVTWSVFLPLVWPVFFYFLNRKRIRSYQVLNGLRVESILLLIIGYVMVGSYLKFSPLKDYLAFVEKQRNGELGTRTPAGNDSAPRLHQESTKKLRMGL